MNYRATATCIASRLLAHRQKERPAGYPCGPHNCQIHHDVYPSTSPVFVTWKVEANVDEAPVFRKGSFYQIEIDLKMYLPEYFLLEVEFIPERISFSNRTWMQRILADSLSSHACVSNAMPFEDVEHQMQQRFRSISDSESTARYTLRLIKPSYIEHQRRRTLNELFQHP